MGGGKLKASRSDHDNVSALHIQSGAGAHSGPNQRIIAFTNHSYQNVSRTDFPLDKSNESPPRGGKAGSQGGGNACGILLWFAPTAIEQLNLVTISGNGGRVARSLRLLLQGAGAHSAPAEGATVVLTRVRDFLLSA